MSIIAHDQIQRELEAPIDTSPARIKEIFTKARLLKGIDYNDVLALLKLEDKNLVNELFETASYVKNEIYGSRLVLFAPLYISNLCHNECLYCAFRTANNKLVRKALKQDEIAHETELLIAQGHKRALLVAGEAYGREGLDYVLNSIDTVYKVNTPKGNIRRVNVNIAPLQVDEFKRLNEHNIGTYQIFQETYHPETYKKLHLKGPKANFDFRLEAIDRAFQGGLHDVGVGILFGLHDWRYEILALLHHIRHLEKNYGVGPHTISVPRIEPALGSDVSYQPPFAVSDFDFKKIIAVLRCAVPYTGIILSTRESAQMRRAAFELGVSQISAGSKTNPGGYGESESDQGTESQFSLGDTRSLLEVIKDVVHAEHVPSFCTGCYRLGRVGKDFMDLAKPGLIKAHCLPNALFTFAEFIHDFGDEELSRDGYALMERMIDRDIVKTSQRENVRVKLLEIKNGKRDIYF